MPRQQVDSSGRVWTGPLVGERDAAWYMLEPSRSAKTIRGVLGDFEGIVARPAPADGRAHVSCISPSAPRSSSFKPPTSRIMGACLSFASVTTVSFDWLLTSITAAAFIQTTAPCSVVAAAGWR